MDNFQEQFGQEFTWETSHIQANSDPVVDPKKGDTVSIRYFKFKLNPTLETKSKQQLFNVFQKQIKDMLWADGLRPLDELDPRAHLKDGFFEVFVPSKARPGVTWTDKAQSLNEIINGNTSGTSVAL